MKLQIRLINELLVNSIYQVDKIFQGISAELVEEYENYIESNKSQNIFFKNSSSSLPVLYSLFVWRSTSKRHFTFWIELSQKMRPIEEVTKLLIKKL